MSRDHVDLLRRNYGLINSLGRTAGFVNPEELATDLWERFGGPHERDRALHRSPVLVRA
ncbi:MAG: hypothetical protein ACJ77G_06890 [Solirubrobacteraceae bacterium]